MGKVKTFKDWNEYKENKLASKQADKLYNRLVSLYSKKANGEEFYNLYTEAHQTHLYKKHSALYCQVLSDAYNRTVKEEK